MVAMRKILSILVVAAAGLISAAPAASAPSPRPATLTVPDGVFGGEVVGVYTGDAKALGPTGGVLVKCYTPDINGTLGLETGFAIADDYTVLITPLAGWGTGWESGPGDCTAEAGYYTKPHDSKYNPTQRVWISLATDTFHVAG